MNKFHTILLDQASRTVLKNLNVFVKDDINQVKDYKGHFLKVSEGYDNALIKNAQVRTAEIFEIVFHAENISPFINRRAKIDHRKSRRLQIFYLPPSLASSTLLWTMSTI